MFGSEVSGVLLAKSYSVRKMKEEDWIEWMGQHGIYEVWYLNVSISIFR